MARRREISDSPAFKWSTKVEDEWVDLQCAFNDLGVRCEHYGTMSPSTNGRGPWYCRRHFGPSGTTYYSYGPRLSGQSQIKALQAQLGRREPGSDG